MNLRPLKKLVRIARGQRRERRYTTVRHQLLHNPSVPRILEFLGVQTADRRSQESAVQRAVHTGWLFPPERNLLRTAGWPGI